MTNPTQKNIEHNGIKRLHPLGKGMRGKYIDTAVKLIEGILEVEKVEVNVK